MMLSLDIPKKLHVQIEKKKRETGLSKSDIVRQILIEHFKKAAKAAA